VLLSAKQLAMSAARSSELTVSIQELLSRADWMTDAACQGRGHLFFPPLAERPQARVKRERLAQVVCDACPVLAQCRRYARDQREYGFWGGESEAARAAAGFAAPNPIGMRSRRPAAERSGDEPAALGEAS
jgi:WhiB family transcriptional regulator, redox-sensing transcriptional regulator